MRWFLVVAAVATAVTGSASAELVARVPDGMLAVTPGGAPLVGFVRGQQLVIAQRAGRERWVQRRIARVVRGSSLATFKAGIAGPVAVVVGPSSRSLAVVRRDGDRWQTTILTRRLGADVSVGWPGLTLARGGLPVVAYTYWHSRSLFSDLFLAKLDPRGRAHTRRTTTGGWPKSYTPPPAAPVVVGNGSVHVVETYGVSGAVGTIEWTPRRHTWIGLSSQPAGAASRSGRCSPRPHAGASSTPPGRRSFQARSTAASPSPSPPTAARSERTSSRSAASQRGWR